MPPPLPELFASVSAELLLRVALKVLSSPAVTRTPPPSSAALLPLTVTLLRFSAPPCTLAAAPERVALLPASRLELMVN